MKSKGDKYFGLAADDGSIVVLMTMCVALMLSMFNASMIGVLLPSIADSILASSTDLRWIATIYMLGLAASLLPGSALGKQYGRKRALLCGLSTFLLGSLICLSAQSIEWLLLGRLAQAVGVGIYIPQTLSILAVEYSDSKRRARAIGMWSGVASIGLVVGPLIGGVGVIIFDWRAGFGLSSLLCGCALACAWKWLSPSLHGKPRHRLSMDYPGMLLSVFWLSCFIYSVSEASRAGWHAVTVVCAMLATAIGLMAFLGLEHWRYKRGLEALMPLGIWRNKKFVLANLGGSAFFFSLFGVLFFYSIFFYVELNYSSIQTGAAFIPMTLMMGISASIGGRLVARFGVFSVLYSGSIAASLALFLLSSATEDKNQILVELFLALLGVGFGLLSASTSNGAVSSVALSISGLASGIHTTCRQIGSALGISVLGMFVHGKENLDIPGQFAIGLGSAMQFSALLVLSISGVGWCLLRRS